MTCPDCQYAAKFHSYQTCRVLTVHGEVQVRRAYYRCARCTQSFVPYDDVLGLRDSISPGFRPLVCLAGALLPFADAGFCVQLNTGAVVSTPNESTRKEAQFAVGSVSCVHVGLKSNSSVNAQSVVK